MGLPEKTDGLKRILRGYPALIVAYSGGVDSTLLLFLAHAELGQNVLAVTARSPIHPARELRLATEFTAARGIRHKIIDSREIQQADFLANPSERCYVCKKYLLGDLIELGRRLGIQHVAHGANVDDSHDFRPGSRAAREMGIAAPLVEAGLTKADIRRLSRDMGLPTWNKPSMACLASRIPYGTPITEKALKMIDAAEEFILALGFATVRVRQHGDIARIELKPGECDRMLAAQTRLMVVKRLKELGFRYVALDLEGYTTGSLNRALPRQKYVPGAKGKPGNDG
ncbi:MAG: ATP-dependent sacrificial sulfur transferase LarE [Desulfobacterales bacterium]